MTKRSKYRFGSRKRLFAGLISIVMLLIISGYVVLGLIGAYKVLPAEAFDFPTAPPKFFTFFEDVVVDGVNGVGPPGGWSAGQEVSIVIRASFTMTVGQTQQVVILATADDSRVQYLGYECALGICSGSGWNGSTGPVYGGVNFGVYNNKSAIICMDIPPGQYNHVNLMTFRYKTRAAIAGQNPSAAPDGWFAVRGAATNGSCNDNRSANGIVFGDYEASEGGCGGGSFTVACTGGPGDGTTNSNGSNSNGVDNGPTGNGSSGTGDGGGGGGGTSANTQGDRPDTVPSSSSQGDADNINLEPSPFFDGKQYHSGSSSYDSSNTIAVAGLRLGYGWLYVLSGLLVLTGIGGFSAWRYRQKIMTTFARLRRP